MEFELGNGAIMLPSLHITIMAIVIIYLLVKWSKQLETGGIKVFIYFMVSTYIIPVFSYSSPENDFQLWFPIGFILVLLYLLRRESYHSAKMKASVLGLVVAIYQIVVHLI